ncbi:MAG: FecR domain-containing protein [Dysgonamonadaceae bacterium]|jgi:hypothetical protein|nr:FecR domain-containing protein [Dysgonamonadaceae bacterium]
MNKNKQATAKSSFEEAGRKIIRQIKHAEHIEPSEIHPLWIEIENRIRPSSVPKNKPVRLIISIAASIAILLSAGTFYLYKNIQTQNLTTALLDGKRLQEVGNDILLVSENGELKLKDESSIQYESDGQVNVNGSIEKDALSEKKAGDNICELIVPKGKRASITFSDGTVMYINSDTRVIYPAVFKKKVREVLVDGEVFLDVNKDLSRPFVVKTKGFNVKVSGTQFNIHSYRNEAISSVVLVSGGVEVETGNKNKTILQPNQLMEITGNNVNVKEVNVFEYVCWKDNMLSLNDKSAGDILERLSRYYGRTIIYDDEVRKVLSISGKLDIKETAEEAVEVVCLSLSLKYTVDENNNIVVTLK